jgi:hypothetical protein
MFVMREIGFRSSSSNVTRRMKRGMQAPVHFVGRKYERRKWVDENSRLS